MISAKRIAERDVPQRFVGGGSSIRILISRSTVAENHSTLGVGSFAPGAVSDPLAHEVEELLYVIEGEGELGLDDDVVSFVQGDALFVPSGVWHWIANRGSRPVRMVFVFSYREYPVTQRRHIQSGSPG